MLYSCTKKGRKHNSKMKIKRITVGNYKNIALTTLDLSKMISLVSPNNYGKSNLLEAIQFGLDFITDAAKSRKLKMRMRRGIPLISALADKNYSFIIEFDEPALEEYRFVKYGFSFSWYNDQGTGARIIDETIEIRATESVKYTTYLKRNEGKYRASKSTSAFRKLELADDALAIDAIGMIKDVEIAAAINAIKGINYRVCDSLELDDSFRPNPIEIEIGDNITFGNEDIPWTLAMLREKREDLYNLFVETVYDLFPEFKSIELQILTAQEKETQESQTQEIVLSQGEGGNTEIKIPYHIRNELFRLIINSKYLNQPISMELMSTGTKRIFWLITNAVIAGYRQISLMGVDEIETSIHPRMIRGLLEALSDILEDTSLIVTSHSPFLINYLKPEAIYVGIPNVDGSACFKRIQNKKIKTLVNTVRKMDMSIGEYLFELMSGDEDSASILSTFLEDA